MKRSPLKTRRVKDTGFSRVTAEVILSRDCWACARCGRGLFGERGLDYSIQHRRARGAGGSRRPDTNSPQNGVSLRTKEKPSDTRCREALWVARWPAAKAVTVDAS